MSQVVQDGFSFDLPRNQINFKTLWPGAGGVGGRGYIDTSDICYNQQDVMSLHRVAGIVFISFIPQNAPECPGILWNGPRIQCLHNM